MQLSKTIIAVVALAALPTLSFAQSGSGSGAIGSSTGGSAPTAIPSAQQPAPIAPGATQEPMTRGGNTGNNTGSSSPSGRPNAAAPDPAGGDGKRGTAPGNAPGGGSN
ncbi:hypothetical protein GJW-30_1_01099 [Variibacter gotjawalensis]|uniref:Translation initiation factor IF-2 n=1 Tax=Variibacter gotjawalensis TaxID=1333996 RepID=A0A0S3PRQ4_9BRAD|nr:hypothetical protein [Variibacter gotjawalensis]NIK48880.1 hypothetical protein [Variibacter gotjawalensis]RZS50737.1 hypothetical protein EV661_3207 [Variibacter gotjawalensis]BAT58573.1 hypothetical protein GJW-30_1_01099 [Variibacter gotjawalensis]